ncbi:hypothetical protein SAMN04488689_10351 [Paenibacillus sp. cl6col]|nr:hypothetical protein SAMN04488689_10351 [Paenibacillus sp. cl6col]
MAQDIILTPICIFLTYTHKCRLSEIGCTFTQHNLKETTFSKIYAINSPYTIVNYDLQYLIFSRL